MARDNAYLRFLRDPDVEARRAELAAFVGPNAAPFLRMYDRLRASPERPRFGAMLSFVSMAFLLGPCWFFYRRMWVWGWGVLALVVALALLPWMPRTLGAVEAVVFATQGRYAYLTHAFARIERVRGAAATADLDALRREGGVSRTAGWVSGLLYVSVCVAAVVMFVLAGGEER